MSGGRVGKWIIRQCRNLKLSQTSRLHYQYTGQLSINRIDRLGMYFLNLVSQQATRSIRHQGKRMNVMQQVVTKESYRRYLKSDRWIRLSRTVKIRDGWACRICNKTDTKLKVHHRSYDRVGQPDEILDCISVCLPCHFMIHKA